MRNLSEKFQAIMEDLKMGQHKLFPALHVHETLGWSSSIPHKVDVFLFCLFEDQGGLIPALMDAHEGVRSFNNRRA